MTSLSTPHQDKATFLERLIFNNRPAVIVICLLVSVFLFWQDRAAFASPRQPAPVQRMEKTGRPNEPGK